MVAELFDCKGVANNYLNFVKTSLSDLQLDYGNPFVKFFLATEDKGSITYSKLLKNTFKEVGIDSQLVELDDSNGLEKAIKDTTSDLKVTGCFVFYPIKFKDKQDNYFQNLVAFDKDIEGLNERHLFELQHYHKTFEDTSYKTVAPCTSRAVIKLLTDSQPLGEKFIQNKDVVIINRSPTVGIPLRFMFENLGATVTACDINTKKESLKYYLNNADIIFTAVPGKKELFTGEDIKENVYVIDGSFEGNFNSDEISKKAGRISSRGTGNYMGMITTAMAILNTLYLFKYQKGINS